MLLLSKLSSRTRWRLRALAAGACFFLLQTGPISQHARAEPAANVEPAKPADASGSEPTSEPSGNEHPAVAPPVVTLPDSSPAVAPPSTSPQATLPALPTVSGKPTVPIKLASPTKQAIPPVESLRSIITRLKLPLPLPQVRIVVTKSKRTLELYSGATLIKTYRVALGSNPSGHKQNQGDGRTPEGQFYICTRNDRNSAFHMFLGLSYPALPDVTRAVNQKVISWRDYQVIRQRLSSRSAPLWGTRLGGWVGIHGGTGKSFAQRKSAERLSPDWTAGCIAVTDAEISEIFAATKFGTSVVVKP